MLFGLGLLLLPFFIALRGAFIIPLLSLQEKKK